MNTIYEKESDIHIYSSRATIVQCTLVRVSALFSFLLFLDWSLFADKLVLAGRYQRAAPNVSILFASARSSSVYIRLIL